MSKKLFVIATAIVLVYCACWVLSFGVAKKAAGEYAYAWKVNDETIAAAYNTKDLIQSQCSRKDARALQWSPERIRNIDRSNIEVHTTPFIWSLWIQTVKMNNNKGIVQDNTLDNITYIDQATQEFMTYAH
ncbi:hypothetical protein FHX77_001220 [Bifidobacterium commune]|uniref:Uncharacterized protein n=1 Tax=Bifidobacterium commune TaxID=1505727 RepID=A0A1C4H5P8_9BIFI|nr:hypothetical protein [Bifidobacterium commune]MBB2955788.1 hypothetical protein [Bifidobacterium commune]SCC80062.1 hypothetical protein GA0061077_0976 [Bifidobacterium commune]